MEEEKKQEKKIVIVTESGADIAPEYIDKYGLVIVPMYVTMGDSTFPDGSFPVTDLFEYYDKTGKLPQTSAPSPNDYEEAFEKIHEAYPKAEILHLCCSKVISCSYQNSVIASHDMPFVTHIDTKSISGGQALIVFRTAQYIEEHPDITIKGLRPLIEEWIAASRMVFVPQNLEYLRAGGRVSNGVYLGASLLSIKPLIEILDGELASTKKYRGKFEKMIPQIITDFFNKSNPDRNQVCVLWAEGFDHQMNEIVEKELLRHGVGEPLWIKTGTVITTHGGPGVFGLSGFNRSLQRI